ncbi:MAG: aminotransferase class V-fold PLP-dependent enzyme [Actinobacteria bacterium]|nr:aminotransferase class V-fold PLP-dependent enzyme [Actinomycetota bacterium]
MRRAYLDHYAARPVLPEVLSEMMPFLEKDFGNPSSLHSWGDGAREALETARARVAGLIGAPPEEIIFTSGGTEANNLAVKGISWAARKKGNHVIISGVEHFSVLHAASTLEKFGFEVTHIEVDQYGMVDPDLIINALRDETVLISVMTANGEIGTIQPITEIAQISSEKKIPFHTDAVAAAGYLPINVKEMGVDALSLASDMIYGPKGAGALWIRKGLRIMPLFDGGTQEGGRRGGTENVPGLVGMGKAAELAGQNMKERVSHLENLRDLLIEHLPATVPYVRLTGHPEKRLPWNASFVVEFIEGEGMLLWLDNSGVAVSSGSACTSRALKGSHVLTACEIPPEIAQGSLLFSFGIDNTPEDVDYVIEVLPPIIEKLRQMSPLYDKFVKEGGK